DHFLTDDEQILGRYAGATGGRGEQRNEVVAGPGRGDPFKRDQLGRHAPLAPLPTRRPSSTVMRATIMLLAPVSPPMSAVTTAIPSRSSSARCAASAESITIASTSPR